MKKIKATKSIKKGLSQCRPRPDSRQHLEGGAVQPDRGPARPRVRPGYYKIVPGEHRYYVVAKMMKEEAIACRVFADMSDEEAELALLSENACRTNAKPTDRLLLLRKWQEVYQKHFPHLEGKKASGNSRWANSTKAEAKQKAIDEEKAQDAAEGAAAAESNDRNGHYSTDDAVEVEVEIASESAEGPVTAQASTRPTASAQGGHGTSDSTLSRDLKINEGLTEEQILLPRCWCSARGLKMVAIIDATPGDEGSGARS